MQLTLRPEHALKRRGTCVYKTQPGAVHFPYSYLAAPYKESPECCLTLTIHLFSLLIDSQLLLFPDLCAITFFLSIACLSLPLSLMKCQLEYPEKHAHLCIYKIKYIDISSLSIFRYKKKLALNS